jgi:hypothetical protein
MTCQNLPCHPSRFTIHNNLHSSHSLHATPQDDNYFILKTFININERISYFIQDYSVFNIVLKSDVTADKSFVLVLPIYLLSKDYTYVTCVQLTFEVLMKGRMRKKSKGSAMRNTALIGLKI